jgi:hypothetical protein
MPLQHSAGAKTPAQLFALVFGVVYLLVGIVGFAITRSDVLAGQSGDTTLVIFAVNALHNLLHLAVGATWLVASQARAWARTANLLLGIAYALQAVLGFAGVVGFLNIGSLLDPDNILHLGTAVVAIYFGSTGAEQMAQPFGRRLTANSRP